MKQTIYIAVVGVILAVLLSVGINSYLSKPTSGSSVGAIAQVGQTETNLKWFAAGLFGGNAQQFGVDVSGNVTLPSINGVYKKGVTANFAAATTTLGCVLNPFGATSTVSFARVAITGPSTSSAISLYITTSSVAYGLTTSTSGITGSTGIIQIVSVAAGTTGVAYNGNNVAITGVYAAGTVSREIVGANQYVCIVAGDGATGSTANILASYTKFAGNYTLEFNK